MKKFYTTLLFALVAIAASAEEKKDTTYVMFDFNLNPWNYPVSSAEKGWSVDYNDETGAIFKETEFPWPIAEGSDKNIVVTVYPADLDEYSHPAILCRRTCVNAGIETSDGSDSIMTMLFTAPGTTMRFKAPSGYKFGKMFFYDYRSSYYVLDTEENIQAYRYGSWHTDTHKIWVPTTPKINKNNENCWEGDETNILFNHISNFKGNFMKIDMRLVPDGSAGINDLQTTKNESNTMTTLDGRSVNKSEGLRKGVYIVDGKKVVVK